MKTLGTVTAQLVALAALVGGTACAGTLYPVAPAGTSVALRPGDFIQFVPEQSPGLPDPNPVIGDYLGQHPGAFAIGFPAPGTFFIGIFGGPINTSDPNAAVFLWETTGWPNGAFGGPRVQLGYWNGMAFTPYGNPQEAFYSDTGVLSDLGPPLSPEGAGKEIYSSILPLNTFGISPGFPFVLNAVRIEAADEFAHNQVTAVAANTVPEPSTLLLLGTCMVGTLFSYGWGRRKLFSRSAGEHAWHPRSLKLHK